MPKVREFGSTCRDRKTSPPSSNWHGSSWKTEAAIRRGRRLLKRLLPSNQKINRPQSTSQTSDGHEYQIWRAAHVLDRVPVLRGLTLDPRHGGLRFLHHFHHARTPTGRQIEDRHVHEEECVVGDSY